MKSLRLMLLLPAIAWLASSPAWAVDSVTRRDGSSMAGEIQSVTKNDVTIKQGAKVEKIPVNDIDRVLWNGEPLALKNARGLEANGDFVKATEFYNQAQEGLGSVSDLGKKDVKYMQARLKAQIALLDPSKVDEAIAELEAFKSANGDFFRYYELHEYLGKVYAAKGDVDKAKAAFSELANAPYNDFKLKGQILMADVLLKTKDVAGAEKEYAAVASAAAQTPQEIEQKNLGRLGQAGCMTLQGKPQEAVDLLDAVINETDKSQTSVQARAFLLKGNAMKTLGKDQQAVMAYLGVDLLFANQSELHAEALFNLAQLWAKVGKSDRASDARARLQAKYPQSPWIAQLK